MAAKRSAGSLPSARENATSSKTDAIRSPCSNFAMRDWGTLSSAANWRCVSPAACRASLTAATTTRWAGERTHERGRGCKEASPL
jgi:hypothetical protein